MTNSEVTYSTDAKQPKFFYGYIIILASFLILIIDGGVLFSYGVFFKPILNEFGWTRAEISGAHSLNMVIFGFLGFIVGKVNDRLGPRLLVTVCGIFVGLGYLLMAQVSAIWQIYLFYGVLVGAGIGGIWVPLLSTLARWFTKRRGLATGIVASGLGVGTAIMPPFANQLISSYGWRISYVIIGLSAMALITIIAQFLKRVPSQIGLVTYGAGSVSTDTPNLGIPEFSMREATRTRQFWMICVIFLCAGFFVQSVMVHIIPHATDIGVSEAVAATILSVIGILNIGGKVGMGSIIDRIGSKRVVIIALVLVSVSFLCLLFANELWMLYLFAVVFGLGYGGFVAAESPIVAEFFGLRAHGAIFGLAMFAIGLGQAIGPLVAGSIFDMTRSYYWAFILCAILGVVGLILAILLKPAHKAS